jgi:hypothetical protein
MLISKRGAGGTRIASLRAMTQLSRSIRDLPADAEQAVHRAAVHAGPAIALLARAGYAAKGVVYALVGALSLLAAAGRGGSTTGSRGALRSLLDHSYGQAILSVIAIGLGGYALWCFVRALLDPERDGTGAKGIARRLGNLAKGVVHAALVVAVVGMARGTAGGGDDDGVRDWTAWLMSFPLGIWLVAIAGASVVVYGLRQLYRAWTIDLDHRLSLGRMSAALHQWTIRFSRFGMAARGVVFGVIGTLLVLAALHANPGEAKGVGGALQTLQRQPFGRFLLAAVALGLVAYGAYQLILARYRRIEPA